MQGLLETSAALRGCRRARLGCLDGQGHLQGRPARRRHRHGRLADAAARYDDPLDPQLARRVGDTLGYPVFVKPATLGSSVGISKVHDASELPAALELAFRHDPKVLVEALLTGREVECGVLGNERPAASAVGEIRPHAEWYDYGAKYDEGGSDIVVPADIPARRGRTRPRHVLDAFLGLRVSGMARVDFFLSDRRRLVLSTRSTRSPASPAPRSTPGSSRLPASLPRGARPAGGVRARPPRAARALPLLTRRYGRAAVRSFDSASSRRSPCRSAPAS